MTDEQEPAWAAEDGRIVDLAIDLRSVLTDLMGDDAFRIDRTLDDLIAQALAGHNVAAQIAATLRSHELTSRWLDLALAGSSEEANCQLLGKPARAPADGGRFGGTRGLGDRGDWTADRGVGVDPEPGGGDLGGSDGPAATRGIDFDRFDPGPGPRAEPPERAAVAPPTAPAAAAPPTAPAGAAPGPPTPPRRLATTSRRRPGRRPTP